MTAPLRTSQEKQEFEEYIKALFRETSEADLLNKIGDLRVPQPYRIRNKVLYSREEPALIFQKLASKGRIQKISENSNVYIYSKTVGRNLPREVSVAFYISSFDVHDISARVQSLIAICKRDQWKLARRLVKSLYPKLVPILLSQHELIHCVRKLNQRTEEIIHVKAISGKESITELDGKKIKSVREWTNEELDRAIETIQDRSQKITSIEIEFFPSIAGYPHVRPSATCKIQNDGEIEVSGSYRTVHDAVVKQVAQIGEGKLGFYSKRGLREARYTPRPLAINYSKPIFSDIKIVRDFVKVLTSYPHSMHAVEHGNPYAHLKITDFFDGSSFDIWATLPNQIAMIPGLKATEAAFERLIHYVFDVFREGEVTDYGS